MRLLFVIVAVVILGITVKYAVDYYYDRPFHAQRASILSEARQQVNPARNQIPRPVRGERDIDGDGRTDFRFDPEHWYIRVGTSWVEVGMMKSKLENGCYTIGRRKSYHFVNGEWILRPEKQ